jgi:hypothetical protein
MSLPSLNVNGAISAPKKELLRGTVVAAIIAGVILTIAVLPAEYGIDPTGIGKALGLTSLHVPAGAPAPDSTSASAPSAAPAAELDPVAPAPQGSQVASPGEARALTVATKQTVDYRADIQEWTLAPGKGLEVKANLAQGATLIYAWKTKNGELINHDFHGDPANAKNNEFESFIAEKGVSQSRASLIAPFTGVHGWYWKNKTSAPVTLVLQASGFYTNLVKK